MGDSYYAWIFSALSIFNFSALIFDNSVSDDCHRYSHLESYCSPSCGQCESQWRLPIPEISVNRPIHIMIATICGWYVSGYEFLFVSGGSEVWYLRLEFDEFHWDSQWSYEGVQCFCVSKNLQMRSICLV